MESYLKSKVELEDLQRSRFKNVVEDLYKQGNTKVAHQFLLFLFNHEMYNSMVLKFLV